MLLTDLLLHLPVLLMLSVGDMVRHNTTLVLQVDLVDQDLVEHQVEVVVPEHQDKEMPAVDLVMCLIVLMVLVVEEEKVVQV